VVIFIITSLIKNQPTGMNDKNLIVSIAGILVVIGVVLYFVSGTNGGGAPAAGNLPPVTGASSPVAQFAQCLKDKGVTFYGAFWCPHCKAQKALFGDAVPYLPYIECSTPDGNAQTQICIDKKITGYPTWEFADGSRVSGEQTFAQLADKSQCPIPATK
jgi:thiol-disulfide isomerase/thioredoxin